MTEDVRVPSQPERKCMRTGCEAPAASAIAIEFYPPKALMEHFHTTRYLTRIVLGLEVCEEHGKGLEAVELIGREQLERFAKLVTANCGTAIDIEASRVVPIGFTDPEYLALLHGRKGAQKPQSTGAKVLLEP